MQCLHEPAGLENHAEGELWSRLHGAESHCTPGLCRLCCVPTNVPGRLSQGCPRELLLVLPHLFEKEGYLTKVLGFANAITMTNSSLSDAYPYYLPLGTDMPVGVRPNCSPCLKRTMDIFQAAASNTTQPVSRTYITAAQQIDLACGPDFVPETIAYKASASPRSTDSRIAFSPVLAIFLLAVAFFQ
jgi:hypothetical protein